MKLFTPVQQHMIRRVHLETKLPKALISGSKPLSDAELQWLAATHRRYDNELFASIRKEESALNVDVALKLFDRVRQITNRRDLEIFQRLLLVPKLADQQRQPPAFLLPFKKNPSENDSLYSSIMGDVVSYRVVLRKFALFQPTDKPTVAHFEARKEAANLLYWIVSNVDDANVNQVPSDLLSERLTERFFAMTME